MSIGELVLKTKFTFWLKICEYTIGNILTNIQKRRSKESTRESLVKNDEEFLPGCAIPSDLIKYVLMNFFKLKFLNLN